MHLRARAVEATGTRQPLSAIDRRSQRGLDWLNFFVANLQTAFGPFIAVYLTGAHWTQGQIGLVLSVGSVTAMASQVPAGAAVDLLRNKHAAAGVAIVAIVLSCLLLAVLPERLPVTAAEILHGFASCMLNPAIAAITLSVVAARALDSSADGPNGPRARSAEAAADLTARAETAAHTALGERFGRNASFASIGSAVAAGLMGGVGYLVSAKATFFLGAALALPGLMALRAIARIPEPPVKPGQKDGVIAAKPKGGLRTLLHDRRLAGFSICIALFYLGNAGVLSLAAGEVTRDAGSLSFLVIAACMLLPQIGGAALSPLVGRWAGLYGRRPIILIAFATLPLRCVLLAISPSPVLIIAVQTLDAISSSTCGVMLPLVASDISRGTGRFNLCMGLIGLAMGIGASFSTTLAGFVADRSIRAGFLMLGGAGLAAVIAVWLLFVETAPGPVSSLFRRARAGRADSARAGTSD